MASGIYNRFKSNLFNKVVDLEADLIKVMLLDDKHSFNAANCTVGEINANEIGDGNGYSTGGATLAGKSVTEAATTKWDATDTAWGNASFTAYHAALYDDTVTGDDLICSFDFGGAKTVSSGTFTIQWNSDGIITLA